MLLNSPQYTGQTPTPYKELSGPKCQECWCWEILIIGTQVVNMKWWANSRRKLLKGTWQFGLPHRPLHSAIPGFFFLQKFHSHLPTCEKTVALKNNGENLILRLMFEKQGVPPIAAERGLEMASTQQENEGTEVVLCCTNPDQKTRLCNAEIYRFLQQWECQCNVDENVHTQQCGWHPQASEPY